MGPNKPWEPELALLFIAALFGCFGVASLAQLDAATRGGAAAALAGAAAVQLISSRKLVERR